MEDNPYSALINRIIPIDNQLTLYNGKIIKTSPLTISVAGITVSGNELMVNASMLKHKSSIDITEPSGTLSAGVNCSFGAISSISVSGGNISASSEITPDLAVGDTVLLLTADTQLFYVLCKVVGV